MGVTSVRLQPEIERPLEALSKTSIDYLTISKQIVLIAALTREHGVWK